MDQARFDFEEIKLFFLLCRYGLLASLRSNPGPVGRVVVVGAVPDVEEV